MNILTPEFIERHIIKYKKTLLQVANESLIPLETLERYCFSLSKSYPNTFAPKYFITKDWLELKLEENTLVELANLTELHYRVIYSFKEKLCPDSRRKISDEISRDILWQLYVEEEMTDKAISQIYNTNPATIKRLRYSYNISPKNRKNLKEYLPIELFYRLYVVSRIGIPQIAKLYNTTRRSISVLKEEYIKQHSIFAKLIAKQDNTGYYPKYLSELIDILDSDTLIQELKTKTLFEVAYKYKLIPPTSNTHTPLSREWLQAELLSKNVNQISNDINISSSQLHVLIQKYKLSIPNRTKIDESILNNLYISKCWDDLQIAEHFGVSASTIKRERFKYNITIDKRPPVEERIPPDLFKYLYINEKLTLAQISAIFDIPISKIRKLRKQYINNGHTELSKRGSGKISAIRLEYLKKQLNLGILTY